LRSTASGDEFEAHLRKQAMRLYRAELLGYKGILIHTENQDTFIHNGGLDQCVMLHETLDLRTELGSTKATADRIPRRSNHVSMCFALRGVVVSFP
jgi:hypothetical protein